MNLKHEQERIETDKNRTVKPGGVADRSQSTCGYLPIPKVVSEKEFRDRWEVIEADNPTRLNGNEGHKLTQWVPPRPMCPV